MDIKPNVGETDRYVRVGAGAVLLILGILGYAGTIPVAVGPLPQALTSLVLVVLGAILAVTGLMRTCPIYMGLGLNTLRR
jgi:hypothetical protein